MEDPKPIAQNYAVAFIDLLGQRNELKAHRILPSDPEERKILFQNSVWQISKLHKRFDDFYNQQIHTPSIFDQLPIDVQKQLGDARRSELRNQRFSDGLVVFTPLADKDGSLRINGVFSLLVAAGTLCLVQLADGHPVRIGIDVGWGVELNPSELYGAALAHAYELESEVAQWPRVVVGSELQDFLQEMATQKGEDLIAKYRNGIAAECIKRLAKDSDGQMIVDFAGKVFNEGLADEIARQVFSKVKEYVDRQLEKWSNRGDTKLSGRYTCLKHYLDTSGASG